MSELIYWLALAGITHMARCIDRDNPDESLMTRIGMLILLVIGAPFVAVVNTIMGKVYNRE